MSSEEAPSPLPSSGSAPAASTHKCAYTTRMASSNTAHIDFTHLGDQTMEEVTQQLDHVMAGIQRDCREKFPAIGVDMEWTTVVDEETKKRTQGKVALIQIASADHALTIRSEAILGQGDETTNPLRALPGVQTLLSLLTDDSVFKLGVGTAGDASKFVDDYGIKMAPCVDLVTILRCQDVAEKIPETVRKQSSLKNLTSALLNVTLSKDKAVTLSDWGNLSAPLTSAQQEYGLDDVCASFDIGRVLALVAAGSDEPFDEVRLHALAADPSLLAPIEVSKTLMRPLVDVPPPSSKGGTGRRGGGGKGKKPVPQSMPGNGWFAGRQSRYYDNIRVLDNEGNLVFTVDANKCRWYLQRDLATPVKYSPEGEDGTPGAVAEIKLNFKPNIGRYGDAHLHRNVQYFQAEKENRCVVCGSEDSLVRHSIVPTAYRKYMPAAYVSHNSYDMVLVCTACFPRLTYFYDEERRKVADEFGFPLMTNSQVMRQKLKDEAQKDVLSAEAKRTMEQQQVVHDLLKYASALHRHYRDVAKAPAKVAATTEEEPVEEKLSEEPSAACEAAQAEGEQEGSAKKKKKVKNAPKLIPAERIEMMETFIKEHAHLYVYPPMVKKLKRANRVAEHKKHRATDPATKDAEEGDKEEEENAPPAYSDAMRIHGDPLSLESLNTIMIANPVLVYRVDEKPPGADEDGEEAEEDAAAAEEDEQDSEGPQGGQMVRENTGRLPKVKPAVLNHGLHVIEELIRRGEKEDAEKGRVQINGVDASHVDNQLGAFVLRWRSLFLSSMTPKFMPPFWEQSSGILVTDDVLNSFPAWEPRTE